MKLIDNRVFFLSNKFKHLQIYN